MLAPGALAALVLVNMYCESGVPQLPLVDVFHPGLMPEESIACYRIPSLLFVPEPQPTLLAVAEAKQGRLCGDVVNSTLVMRRSTYPFEEWSKPFFPYKPWASRRKWGQPQMVYDRQTKTAILVFSNETLSGSPGRVQHLNTVAQITSTDAGLTWSLAATVDSATLAFPTGWAPTSGVGIQLVGLGSATPVSGRLLFSMDSLDSGLASVMSSDDHGASYNKSYSLSAQAAAGTNEFQLTELHNGSVLAVLRNVLRAKRMEVSVSSDSGRTFGPIRPHPDLVSPSCQGSIVAIPPGPGIAGPSGVVLYAGPRSESSRVNMTVLASLDDGRTFTRGLPIWPNKAGGYSAMQWLGGWGGDLLSQVALLFERDGGNISIARFDVADVNQAIPPPPHGARSRR